MRPSGSCGKVNLLRRPRHIFVLGLLLALTAGILYQPVMNAFFDIQEFISVLQPVAEGRTFMERVTGDWSAPSYGDYFFRPLTSITFILEDYAWGDAPAGYHVVNVALLVITGLLIATFVRWLTDSRPVGWGAGLFFVTYPGATHAVEWISARGDILAVLFSISAMLMTVKVVTGELKGPAASLPAVAALLAAGSKELGLACFLSLPVIYFLWPERSMDRRTSLWFFLSLGIVAAVTITIRYAVLGAIGGYNDLVLTPGEMFSNAGTLLKQTAGALFPKQPVVAYAVIGLVLAGCGVRSLRRLRLILTGALVFGISSFQSIIAMPAEHYAYMGSAVLTVVFVPCLFGLAIFRGTRTRWVPAVLLAVMIVHGFVQSREILVGLKEWGELRRPIFNEYMDRRDELGQDTRCCFVWDGPENASQYIKQGVYYVAYLSALYDLGITPELTGRADRVYPDDVLVRYEPRGRGLLIHHVREVPTHP